jgi:hypothetical protein
MAADSTAFGQLFESRWDKVSALQALNEDPSTRITLERIARLKNNGVRFLELLATRGNAEIDWERDRLALRVILDQRWEAIRRPARFHFDLTSPERVPLYTSLVGIR